MPIFHHLDLGVVVIEAPFGLVRRHSGSQPRPGHWPGYLDIPKLGAEVAIISSILCRRQKYNDDT